MRIVFYNISVLFTPMKKEKHYKMFIVLSTSEMYLTFFNNF